MPPPPPWCQGATDPGCQDLVLPSLPGSPPAPEPPSPRSCDLNKASFHVFIELLPLRHFPCTIRPFEGLGQCGSRAGAGVGNGPRPRPGAELVPSPPVHITRRRGGRGGGLGVKGGNAPGLPFLPQDEVSSSCLPPTPDPDSHSQDLSAAGLTLADLCRAVLACYTQQHPICNQQPRNLRAALTLPVCSQRCLVSSPGVCTSFA